MAGGLRRSGPHSRDQVARPAHDQQDRAPARVRPRRDADRCPGRQPGRRPPGGRRPRRRGAAEPAAAHPEPVPDLRCILFGRGWQHQQRPAGPAADRPVEGDHPRAVRSEPVGTERQHAVPAGVRPGSGGHRRRAELPDFSVGDDRRSDPAPAGPARPVHGRRHAHAGSRPAVADHRPVQRFRRHQPQPVRPRRRRGDADRGQPAIPEPAGADAGRPTTGSCALARAQRPTSRSTRTSTPAGPRP